MDDNDFKWLAECLALQLENIQKLDAILRVIHRGEYPARNLIDALRK